MSAMDGSSIHPPDVVRTSMSIGAPQLGQLAPTPADVCRQ